MWLQAAEMSFAEQQGEEISHAARELLSSIDGSCSLLRHLIRILPRRIRRVRLGGDQTQKTVGGERLGVPLKEQEAVEEVDGFNIHGEKHKWWCMTEDMHSDCFYLKL